MRSSGDENERSDTSAESVSQVSGGSGDLSDAELVHRLEDADREALGTLYHRHGRPCYALARRVCSDDGVAEQVVLEVFLTLWREPRRFDPGRGSVATWLLTLTHRRAVDTVRRLGIQRPPTEAPAAGATSGAGLLTTEQREVLALAYFGGCTQREIAALTGIPLETVKSRLFAGIQRLRVLLKDEEGRDAIAAEGRAIGEVNR
jgi:RNA polymerase sigma-70 factor, ECF subfamily